MRVLQETAGRWWPHLDVVRGREFKSPLATLNAKAGVSGDIRPARLRVFLVGDTTLSTLVRVELRHRRPVLGRSLLSSPSPSFHRPLLGEGDEDDGGVSRDERPEEGVQAHRQSGRHVEAEAGSQ